MKRFFCVGLAVMMAFSLSGCGDSVVKTTPPAPPAAVEPTPTPEAAPSPEVELPEYSVISSSEYMRDGKDCIGYRVEIVDGTSKDDMRNVFKAVTKDDKYFLHTVWFYGLASDVDTVGAYTVGMLEEIGDGSAAVFTAVTLSAADIESMRARSAAERNIPSPSFKQEALVPDNAFSPAPNELFSTPADENGLGGRAYYIEGTVEERSEIAGYDSLRVATGSGEIWISAVTIPLEKISVGDKAAVYFVYSGWSEVLSAAAGEYIYHE